MKKVLFVAVLLFAFGHTANAQMIGATNSQTTPRTTTVSAPYNPWLGWLESFLLPGLGQILETKQYVKGIGMMAGTMVCGSVLANADGVDADDILFVAGVCYLGIWIWSQIDAPLTAKRLNREGGFVLLDTGERGTLSMQPTLDYIDMPLASGRTFATGMKLSLTF